MSALRLLSLSTLMVFSLSAAPIIQYQVVTTGSTGTYTYSLSGFDYRANQPCSNNAALLCDDVLDIQFAVAPPPQQNLLQPAVIFGQLSNGAAGTGFELLLFQPNNPPQSQGDYIALATVDHPSLSGPFTVDFTFSGSGVPGSQPFTISQYDLAGAFENVVFSGSTTATTTAPEPVSFLFCSVGLISGLFLFFRRSRKDGR
jgi:hypothetical protein